MTLFTPPRKVDVLSESDGEEDDKITPPEQQVDESDAGNTGAQKRKAAPKGKNVPKGTAATKEGGSKGKKAGALQKKPAKAMRDSAKKRAHGDAEQTANENETNGIDENLGEPDENDGVEDEVHKTPARKKQKGPSSTGSGAKQGPKKNTEDSDNKYFTMPYHSKGLVGILKKKEPSGRTQIASVNIKNASFADNEEVAKIVVDKLNKDTSEADGLHLLSMMKQEMLDRRVNKADVKKEVVQPAD